MLSNEAVRFVFYCQTYCHYHTRPNFLSQSATFWHAEARYVRTNSSVQLWIFSKTRYCLKERGVKLTHLSFLYLYWPWNWNWDSNVTRERIRALPCAIKDRVFIHFMPVLQPSNPSVFQLRFWRNIGLGYDIVIDWDCLSKQTQQPLSSTETVCFSKPDKQALILGSWSLEAGYDDRASKKLQEVKKEDGWEYAIRLASV